MKGCWATKRVITPNYTLGRAGKELSLWVLSGGNSWTGASDRMKHGRLRIARHPASIQSRKCNCWYVWAALTEPNPPLYPAAEVRKSIGRRCMDSRVEIHRSPRFN